MLNNKLIFDNTFKTPKPTPKITKTFISKVLMPYCFLNLFDSLNRKIDRSVEARGCVILNLVNKADVESKSSIKPLIKDSLGNNTSASAVIDPVAPESINKPVAILKFLSIQSLIWISGFFDTLKRIAYIASSPNVFTR